MQRRTGYRNELWTAVSRAKLKWMRRATLHKHADEAVCKCRPCMRCDTHAAGRQSSDKGGDENFSISGLCVTVCTRACAHVFASVCASSCSLLCHLPRSRGTSAVAWYGSRTWMRTRDDARSNVKEDTAGPWTADRGAGSGVCGGDTEQRQARGCRVWGATGPPRPGPKASEM